MDERCEACGAVGDMVELSCCCGAQVGFCGGCGAEEIEDWKLEHADCATCRSCGRAEGTNLNCEECR